MNKIGVQDDSKLNYIFGELFKAIDESKEDLVEYVKRYGKGKSIREFLESEHFEKDTIKKVEEHIKNCENCRNLLQMIMEDDKEQIRVPSCGPAIRFRRKYQIRLVLGMAFAILTAAGILALLL